MIKRLLALILLSLFMPPINAVEGQSHEVEVRLTSQKLVEIEPGRIVVGSFRVSNHTEHEEDFFEKLELPPDWQTVVLPDGPFPLKANEQEIRIVAFSVPIGCPAGRYQVTYSIKSQRDYRLTDSEPFSVVILPIVKVETLVTNKPNIVIAGDIYALRVQLVNGGNSKAKIKLAVEGNPDYPMEIKPSEISLDAGKSQVVGLEVKTDKRLKHSIKQTLKIKAKIETSKTGVSSTEKTVLIDIVPKTTGSLDPYHRLPTEITLTTVGASGKKGFQVEYSGSGRLDEKGKRSVDFLFRGPDTQNIDIYGWRDEYRLSYYDSSFDLHVGDRSYFLSPLTAGYNYGRGVAVDIHHKAVGLGTFFLQSRWQAPKDTELGTYLKYQLNEKLAIRGNFLNRRDALRFSSGLYNEKIYSVQSELNLGEKLNLEIEYGFSDSDRAQKFSDNAYRVELDGQLYFTSPEIALFQRSENGA